MIILRADGNSRIGSGHIMRCLSLANAAGDRGITCCFVTSGAEFQNIIQARGYKCIVLGTDYANMEAELSALTGLLNDERPDMVFVDSYFVTETYLNALHSFVKLVYIDDLAAFAYPVDTILAYDLGMESTKYENLYRGKKLPQMLIGPKYTPLRKEFSGLDFRMPSRIVKNVFVSTGGADPEHIALRLVQYLQDKKKQKYTFHFLLGTMNQDKDEIERLTSSAESIVVHKDVQNVRELMTSCDVALSAAGNTMYELCACSLPIISYILANNQNAVAQKFAYEGLALLAGDARTCEDFCATLLDRLDELSRDYELRVAMASKAYSIVDGKGASRIIEEVCR